MSKPFSAQSIWVKLLLFIVAFCARTNALGRNVTPDEYFWVYTSTQFRKALFSGQWGETIQSAHPGVITTWLTTFGIELTLLFQPDARQSLQIAENLAWAHSQSGEVYTHLIPFLLGGRLFTMAVVSAGLVLIYSLLLKKFNPLNSLLAVCFIMLDPWLVGLSSILHLDVLMGTFVLIAILLILTADRLNRKILILSGISSALAVLAKLPGILLLFFIPTLIIGRQWLKIYSGSSTKNAHKGLEVFKKIPELSHKIGWWLVGLIPTTILFLPALITNPAGVWAKIFVDSNYEINLEFPIFFMGTIHSDVGPLFYPIAIFIRQSPLVSIGLIVLLWTLLSEKPSAKTVFWGCSLLALSCGFWVGISLSSREFTRYMAPVSMILALVAGLAWGKLLTSKGQTWSSKPVWLLCILQIGWMAWFWPSPLSAANLFTGGPWRLQQQLPVGWADGTSQAAAFAATLPDAASKRLFTNNLPASVQFFPGEVYRLSDETSSLIRPDDIIILDTNTLQINPRMQLDTPALHTVSFNGMPTAWLYPGSTPKLQATEHTQPVRFGEHLTLLTATASQLDKKNELVLHISWQNGAPINYQLRAHVKDELGNIWAKRESPLVSNSGLPAEHWQADSTETLFLTLPLPAGMPPNSYPVEIEIFDEDGNRLGVFDAGGQFLGTSNTISHFPYGGSDQTTNLPNDGVSLNHPILLASSQSPASLGQGEYLNLDLWWKHPDRSTAANQLFLMIGDQQLPFEFATRGWQKDNIYIIKSRWRIPADFAPGEWPIALIAHSDPVGTSVELGTISIEERDRSFDLPATLDPLDIRFGEHLYLQGSKVTVDDSTLLLDLVWQTIEPPQTDYLMFVHLKNKEDEILIQVDRPPQKATSQLVDDEVIFDQIQFDLLENGSHLALGLYDPATGQRLPIFSADGVAFPNDQLILEVNQNDN